MSPNCCVILILVKAKEQNPTAVVKLVRNHPYAGKYIVIDHGNQYITRYMHNSRIMVRKGERIKKGQVIALSGNTGRVTGPHIHYELLFKGKAIDPLKADIYTDSQAGIKDRRAFHQRVANFNHLMDLAQRQVYANADKR